MDAWQTPANSEKSNHFNFNPHKLSNEFTNQHRKEVYR